MEIEYTMSGAAKAPPLEASSALHRFRPSQPYFQQRLLSPNHAPSSSVYLTHLVSLQTPSPSLAALGDDATITLLDKSNGAIIQSVQTFRNARITQLKPYSQASPSSLIGSVSNGSVAIWDSRQSLSQTTVQMAGPSRAPYLAIAPSVAQGSNVPHLVAAGTELHNNFDADIDIWDVRQPNAPLFRYNEVHSDDITTLHFHPDPTHADILLSASTDGLVSAIDTTIQIEDDAVIAVGNTGSSVARAGWAAGSNSIWSSSASSSPSSDLLQQHDETDPPRRNLGTVWAAGDMQTFSVWNADKFDQLLPSVDIRSCTSLQPVWSTDYIIDVSVSNSFPSPSQNLCTPTLFVGTTQGSFGTIQTNGTAQLWSLTSLFPAASPLGHSDVVRCIEWDGSNQTLYSGGEDGVVCFWNFDSDSDSSSLVHSTILPNSLSSTLSSSSKIGKSSSQGSTKRWSPYK